ncbi:MAG: MFS transporter [Desulfarculaceae bacterium]|nr:MFS transporter [Desulfarculaceae bacterium]MCF8073716.1 MFS transporter [Desulfarculaceae bacterium]MCF8101957.1 MFS transporter [Desulfarculaceae bacterium]MCF8115927.1 MFS transporter [Desulfarculaceae bacterium]
MEPASIAAPPPAPTTRHDRRAWAILVVCLWGFLFSTFYRVSVTVILPELSRDLSLSVNQLSDASAAFFYAFAVSQIPLGLVLDRWGSRRVMTVLAACGVAGSIIFAMAGSLATLTLGRVFMGLGMSCNMIGTMVLVGAWFPANRFATITGILVGVGMTGQLLAATPLVLLSQALGWRGAFGLMAAINAVQGMFLWLVVRDAPPGVEPPAAAKGNPLKGWGGLLKRPFYWVISFATFFRYGCINALQGLWAGPYLIYGLGLSAVEAGNALLFIPVGYMLGLPFWGRVSDSVLASRKWVVMPSLWGSAVLTLTLGVMQGAPLWLIDLLFFGLGFATAPGQIMYPHIKELLPDHLTARGLTGINLYTMLGAAGVMQLAGLLVEGEPAAMHGVAGYWPVWVFMALGLGVSGAAYLFIPDSKLIAKKK